MDLRFLMMTARMYLFSHIIPWHALLKLDGEPSLCESESVFRMIYTSLRVSLMWFRGMHSLMMCAVDRGSKTSLRRLDWPTVALVT